MAAPTEKVSVQVVTEHQREGIDSAKRGVEELARKADKAKPSVQGLGDQVDKGGKKYRRATGEVTAMGAALFRSLGITGAASEAARGAGVAYEFAGASAGKLSIALAGSTVALSILLPLIVSWLQKTKDQTKEQEELTKKLAEQLPQLAAYREQIDGVNAALDAQLKATRELALIAQQRRIDALDEEIVKLKQQLGISTVFVDQRLTEAQRMKAIANFGEDVVGSLTKEGKAQNELTAQLQAKEALVARLVASQQAGITLDEEEAAAIERSRLAREATLDQMEREKVLREELAALKTEGFQAQIGEGARRDGEEIARQERLDRERREAIRADLRDRQSAAQQDREEAASERTRDEQRKKAAQQTNDYLLALGTDTAVALFGNNKAVQIAAALVDTWRAANAALATVFPTVPLGVAAAALVTAQGLANVANIRKQNVGFDDPANDLLARELGAKFAHDVLREINSGFGTGLSGLAQGTSSVSTTNVDRSMNFSGPINVGAGDRFGGGQPGHRQLMLWLNRELIKVRRIEEMGVLS